MGTPSHTRPANIARLACAACAGLALLGARLAFAEGAEGEPAPPQPITLTDPGAAPFSSAELTQALLARLLSPEAEAPAVQVSPAGAGTVSVQVGDRSRVVALGDRTGAGAARVVALVIAELASVTPAAETEAAPAAPVVTVAGVANVSSPVPSVERSAPAAPALGRPLRLSVTGGAAKGTGSEEPMTGTVDADAALVVGPSWFRLVPSAGLVYQPTRNAGTFDEVTYSAAVVRLLAGRSWRLCDLLGGAFVEPYSVGGANPHRGVLAGAEALARVGFPLSPRARLLVAARVDAYANRVRVLYVDDGGYATPRLGLALGAGLAWDWQP